jgi:hypothetical protein
VNNEYERNLRGLSVARDWAEWNIGDPSWATEILWAYFNPDLAEHELEAEGKYEADDND